MTPDVAIRLGDARDRDYVLDLGRRIAASSISAVRPAPLPLVQVAFDRLVDVIFAQPFDLLVAAGQQRRCGFLILLRNLPDEVTLTEQGFVAYMAVEPELQRQGIGAALLTAAEEIARAAGLGFLSLMVTEDNVAALRLYERCGLRTERRMLTKALV